MVHAVRPVTSADRPLRPGHAPTFIVGVTDHKPTCNARLLGAEERPGQYRRQRLNGSALACLPVGQRRIIALMPSASTDSIAFGLLGLEVLRGGEPVRLGGERQRVLLAVMLLRANTLQNARTRQGLAERADIKAMTGTDADRVIDAYVPAFYDDPTLALPHQRLSRPSRPLRTDPLPRNSRHLVRRDERRRGFCRSGPQVSSSSSPGGKPGPVRLSTTADSCSHSPGCRRPPQ